MSEASAAAAAPTLARARTRTAAWWKGLAPREQQLVLATGVLVGLAAGWLLFVQPALRTLRTAPAQIDQLEVQLQQMQRLAAESRELRDLPTVSPAQAGIALRSATDRLGARAKLTVIGDRATLTLTGVEAAPLATWLGEARSAARARPIEAQLTRGPQGYAGTLVVQLGGGS